MGDIVIIGGVRYKRARAKALGLLGDKPGEPNTRSETVNPSGLLTTTAVSGLTGDDTPPPATPSAPPAPPATTETPATPPTDTPPTSAPAPDTEQEGDVNDNADPNATSAPADDSASKAPAPSTDTVGQPKVTKARTPSSTRKG